MPAETVLFYFWQELKTRALKRITLSDAINLCFKKAKNKIIQFIFSKARQ
ncbi:hypothetical protein PROSTU_00888 [Providencia stuartii ATCC 25827]|uniref:Uncharacterized protein n=1 Tax=Providencia stuartii ATCC 25827 TaxID=471874 RepID=A0AA87CSP3_PROST|nr:hypothetical protein PROSTU_00888 [Providencia stuartii ATCC 25827]